MGFYNLLCLSFLIANCLCMSSVQQHVQGSPSRLHARFFLADPVNCRSPSCGRQSMSMRDHVKNCQNGCLNLTDFKISLKVGLSTYIQPWCRSNVASYLVRFGPLHRLCLLMFLDEHSMTRGEGLRVPGHLLNWERA